MSVAFGWKLTLAGSQFSNSRDTGRMHTIVGSVWAIGLRDLAMAQVNRYSLVLAQMSMGQLAASRSPIQSSAEFIGVNGMSMPYQPHAVYLESSTTSLQSSSRHATFENSLDS